MMAPSKSHLLLAGFFDGAPQLLLGERLLEVVQLKHQQRLGGSTLEFAIEAALPLDPELDISALLRQLSSLRAIESLESQP